MLPSQSVHTIGLEGQRLHRVGYRVALVVVGLVPGHARTHTHTPERRRDEEDEEGPATETHEDRRYHNDHYCETAEDRRQIDT